jgi:hypothetical protein
VARELFARRRGSDRVELAGSQEGIAGSQEGINEEWHHLQAARAQGLCRCAVLRGRAGKPAALERHLKLWGGPHGTGRGDGELHAGEGARSATLPKFNQRTGLLFLVLFVLCLVIALCPLPR